ncbi:MAG: hypothetical protein PVF73_10325 [Bacteroidales bacterium]|jgi:hypothetical protein
MKIITAVFALFLSTGLFGQIKNDSSEIDSTSLIYAWELHNFYSTPVETDIDTGMTDFHIIYPIYNHSISNTFLSNLGSPAIQNIFPDRIFADEPFFLIPYLPYFQTIENTQFYNTTKPFSRLTYTNGGPSVNREESFEAFHTQNVNSKINFGFRYHVIKSKGQYRYLRVKKNAFRIFGSYTGNRYMFHTVFNLNRYAASENGGINDSSFEANNYLIRDIKSEVSSTFSGSGASKWEPDAENRIRYYDLLISQRLKLFTLTSKADSSGKKKGGSFAEPILTYAFKVNRTTKTYDDADPVTPGFYDSVYFNKQFTLDSVAHVEISNNLQLEFKTVLRGKVQTSVYGLLGYDYENYSFVSPWDSNYFAEGSQLPDMPYVNESGDTLKGIRQKNDVSNSWIAAGIYGNFWNRVRARFFGSVYFAGYKLGNTEFSGLLNSNISILGKEYLFDVAGIIENKIPDYLINNYYSNHCIWKQDLLPQYKMHLSSKIGAPSNKFELRGNYYFFSNFIYFNEDAIPENYSENINYFSVEVEKTFRLWKLFFTNKLVYQVSENQNVLPLPDLVWYNSTYFDHTFRFKKTNGELRTMLGFDIHYNTSFYGYEYSPALSRFYVQNDQLIGDYPLMDAFLKIKIKSVRFFVLLQHFNSGWLEQNYYSAIHYPYNQFALKFGISWIFYN